MKKQAAGFADIVGAAGGSAKDALMLMLADKMEELMKVQVEAIRDLKIDKVTVWDSGEGKDGKSSTANFLSGLMKSIPPMNEIFEMAGMQLPEFLGKKIGSSDETLRLDEPKDKGASEQKIDEIQADKAAESSADAGIRQTEQ